MYHSHFILLLLFWTLINPDFGRDFFVLVGILVTRALSRVQLGSVGSILARGKNVLGDRVDFDDTFLAKPRLFYISCVLHEIC